jgi:hypothetical protein
VREAHALKLRKDGQEVLGQPAERRVVIVEAVRDRAAGQDRKI